MSPSDDSPVAVCFDGSEHARAALGEAARLFEGRPLLVLSAWSPVSRAAAATRIGLPDDIVSGAVEKLDAEAREAAEELAGEGVRIAAEAGASARAETVEASPNVASALIGAAGEAGAAVVVVGSRGRSGLKSALLGSVSQAVVHNAGRPVLVVDA